jgi:hypothetical protein
MEAVFDRPQVSILWKQHLTELRLLYYIMEAAFDRAQVSTLRKQHLTELRLVHYGSSI